VSDKQVEGGLLRAARETLRPIVRRMLACGVPFGRVEARIRELFVELAEQDFTIPGRTQTDSRISLLTGINRKEVRRIRAADGRQSGPKSFTRNIAASLVSVWLTDPQAVDSAGLPKAVPYQSKRGASFVKFARKATADLPPRAILDELVRTGAVELLEGKTVALRSDAYVPKLGQPEKLEMLAEDPAELIDTMLRNIFEEGGDLFLQRKVSYDNVGSDGLSRVRARMRKEGERFLRRMNALLAQQDRDRNPEAPGGERRYAGLGVYYFEAPGKPSRKPKE